LLVATTSAAVGAVGRSEREAARFVPARPPGANVAPCAPPQPGRRGPMATSDRLWPESNQREDGDGSLRGNHLPVTPPLYGGTHHFSASGTNQPTEPNLRASPRSGLAGQPRFGELPVAQYTLRRDLQNGGGFFDTQKPTVFASHGLIHWRSTLHCTKPCDQV